MTTIKPEHLDALLAGYEKPDDLLGENGVQSCPWIGVPNCPPS